MKVNYGYLLEVHYLSFLYFFQVGSMSLRSKSQILYQLGQPGALEVHYFRPGLDLTF